MRGQPLAADARFAQTQQQCRQMCERRKIARRTNRTLGGNDRIHVRIQQPQQRFHNHRANTRTSARKARDFQYQNQPHHFIGERCAHARTVREHQVALQRFELVGGNVRVGDPPSVVDVEQWLKEMMAGLGIG